MNILDKEIQELELNIRLTNAFKNHLPDIKTIGDLVLMSEIELLQTPDIGRKSLNEVKEVLINLKNAQELRDDCWATLRSLEIKIELMKDLNATARTEAKLGGLQT